MTAKDYQRERQRRGTQTAVAAVLGVHQVTIARRETGALPITREAWLALKSLPISAPKRQPRKTTSPAHHSRINP